MKSANDTDSARGSVRSDQDLDGQYGKIGISAVAAAMRFQSEPRNPVNTPVYPQDDE
jgi:hypothetical protein